MKRKRSLLPMLLGVLVLGLAAGFAFTSAGRADEGTTDASPPVTTTDSGTTTDPATTTDAGTTTTDPGTTTDAAPTTTAPAPTTTVGQTTTDSNSGSTDQGSSQSSSGSSGPPPTTTGATTTTPPPTAPCDTTQITCGNNAATQIAVVSQNCTAVSSTPLISVNVTTVDGDPVNNFTIGNVTTCLNVANITQVVQQFCVGCTIVVIPPPPTVPEIVTAADPSVSGPPTPSVSRAGYCMPQPVVRADGSWGRFVDLVEGQPQHDSKYAAAVPATYEPGVGYTCADGSTAATGPTAPMFTLTVPESFVGQYLNLCIQPSDPSLKPVCHAVKIDQGASISIPVASNVAATVTAAKVTPPKSRKQIATAATAYGAAASGHHAKKKQKTKIVKGTMKGRC